MSRETNLPARSRQEVAEVFFREKVEPFIVALREIEAEVDAKAEPVRDDATHRRVATLFQQSQDDCREFEAANRHDPDLILAVQERFREVTDPWFSQSWIAQRARLKPSGFAGDYEMLIKLYEQRTPARGIGGYLDLCISDLPLACAVRARMVSCREFLLSELQAREGDDVRILDIASGPCREFLDWPPRSGQQTVEVVAMDNDPQALEYVERTVRPGLDERTTLNPVRYNALRTRSAKATIKNFGRFDIIYSVGLCDYLSDEHLIGMLSAWRETLTENGALLIAFKDTRQYDKTPYQWHLDWFFFQRTEEDVMRLYREAGFDTSRMTTSRDRTGIIINFLERRTASRILRADAAEGVTHPLPDGSLNQMPQSDER